MLRDYLPRPVEGAANGSLLLTHGGEAIFQSPLSAGRNGELFRHRFAHAGVTWVEVRGRERFWAYTYPGVPSVLVGEESGEGWHRFELESGTRRDWVVHVPAGTERFDLRVRAKHVHDVLDLDVYAPDRIMGRVYGREGALTVSVPPGLDGRLWHLSVGVGSATRYTPRGNSPRALVIPYTLDLNGLPPYLAPTRSQWFDPKNPPGRPLEQVGF